MRRTLMTSGPDVLSRVRRRWKVLSTFSRRQLQKLGPYPSLVAMLLPMALVEPLKIVAVCVARPGTLADRYRNHDRGLCNQPFGGGAAL
jgi:hypothetical protein